MVNMKLASYVTPRWGTVINYCVVDDDDEDVFVTNVLPSSFSDQSTLNLFLERLQSKDVMPCKIEKIFKVAKEKGLYCLEDTEEVTDDDLEKLGLEVFKARRNPSMIVTAYSMLKKSNELFLEKLLSINDVIIVAKDKDGTHSHNIRLLKDRSSALTLLSVYQSLKDGEIGLLF